MQIGSHNGYYPWTTAPTPCPTCGHCPTCGRGGHGNGLGSQPVWTLSGGLQKVDVSSVKGTTDVYSGEASSGIDTDTVISAYTLTNAAKNSSLNQSSHILPRPPLRGDVVSSV